VQKSGSRSTPAFTLKQTVQQSITMAAKRLQCGVAEFVGTFLLVATVVSIVHMKNDVWGAAAIASVLMVSIYALSPVSGGHFNPAVTFSLALTTGDKDASDISVYIVSQLAGAVVASLAFGFLFGAEIHLRPAHGYLVGACLCEVIYTFMLCFVVLNVAASKKKNQYFGLAIGYVIVAGGSGSAALGAGCFNPAVAVGLFLNSGNLFECGFWGLLYIVAELLGAGLAVLLFTVVRPDEAASSSLSGEHRLVAKLMSEFIGTFILVISVGLVILGGSKMAAYSIGAALTCMIYAVGDISGGHFNPAVTVAIYASGKGKQTASEAAQYVGVQTFSGILAALTYALMYRGATFPLGPGLGFGWGDVVVAETLFTFILASVVLGVACNEKSKVDEFAGFIIGSCVVAGGFAAGGISGGSLNPAVSIGIAFAHIMGGGLFWKSIVYSICEIIGGLFAAGIFMIVNPASPEESDSLESKNTA
jgi:aquaporin Z